MFSFGGVSVTEKRLQTTSSAENNEWDGGGEDQVKRREHADFVADVMRDLLGESVW